MDNFVDSIIAHGPRVWQAPCIPAAALPRKMLANRRSIRYNVYLHDTIYVILFHFRKGGGRSFRRNGPCRYMKQTDELRPAVAPLWTRDFTIITLGSVVSMLGNAMPQIIAPIFSGAILDRFSRKRTIYTLDFISAGIYAMAAFILSRGWFSFPVLAVWCFIIGTINSVYMVAYESFYPMLITEGNYSKAYSIASVLETLSAVMIPISTYVYNKVGIAPLLGINAVCFLTAAIAETQIRAEEKYIETQKATATAGESSARRLLRDIGEGFRFLWSEKGLLAVACYFAFSSLAGGASQVITLPYFKGAFPNGEYVYMLVWGMMVVGRTTGGLVHYKVQLPTHRKYAIALTVYIVISMLEGGYLYTPVPVMMAMCLCNGLLGVTSYTIRISATQSYVPDEKKGRFNGAFNMLNTVGSLTGQLVAGALTVVLPPRLVLTAFMLVTAAAAIVFIGGNKTAVSAIYNRQQ